MSTDDHAFGGKDSTRHKPAPNIGSSESCTPEVSLSSGIVVSSRVRLARNIAEFPFLNTCSVRQREEIESTVRQGVNRCEELRALNIVDAAQLQALEHQFLIHLQSVSGIVNRSPEREWIPTKDSSDHEPAPPIVASGQSRLLLNEEDHLRIQVNRDGLDLHTAWQQANEVDDTIEQHLSFAFSPRWGYLTACPADVGTGMRVSVLLHLPALVITKRIKTFLRRLKPLNVIGREVFGDPDGDFFRLSNQATLGWNESELITQVENAAQTVVQAERKSRKLLIADKRDKLTYEVNVALEQLLAADLTETSEENRRQTTRIVSRVRMGLEMELLSPEDSNRVIAKFELIRLRNRLSEAISREDYVRASKLRDRILVLEGGSP